jgi:predicted PurR-regulated permease PerM
MDKKVTVSFSLRSLFTVALALLVLAFVYTVRDIVILFVIAYIVSSAIRPLINLLHHFKIPRTVSIILVYLGLSLALFFVFRVLIPPMAAQVNSLVANRQELASRFTDYFHQLPDGVESAVSQYVDDLPAKVQEFFLSGSTLEGILGLFAGFGGVLTVLFVSFYMLLENSSFEGFISTVWPGETRERERLKKAFHQVDLKVSMWVRGQLILSLSIGVLTFIGLSVLGVPYALVLSIVAAFTELIPIAGPIIGAVPAVIIAFLESPVLVLWVIILTIAIQQFEQHVLVPQVMKRAVGLSAVAVIFSILVGVKIFGILGAVIAVPVAASIVVLSDTLRKRG